MELAQTRGRTGTVKPAADGVQMGKIVESVEKGAGNLVFEIRSREGLHKGERRKVGGR